MSRFERKRQLGSGGMGVVFEAFDHEQGTTVALKTVRAPSPEALQRFKREFRLLQSVSHRNLVRLFELVEEGGEWLLSMELVRGVDFLEWVCGAAGVSTDDETITTVGAPTAGEVRPKRAHVFDEARLRAVLPQIASGLTALHRANRLHKDVKPSNVMITDDGRVVIVDFGVAADLRERAEDGRVAGTIRYMAPEQLVAEKVGPAADWYALGAMLFEALTGRPPFVGTLTAIAQAKQTSLAPRAASVADGVPADLDVLCAALLARDPTTRASGDDVQTALGGAEAHALWPKDAFIGRRDELTLVQHAYDASRATTVSVLCCGESGVGKSALLARCVEDLRARGAFVVAGRCYERESVPYKALDEVIDRISSALLGDDETLYRGLSVLSATFPAFRRVAALDVDPPKDVDPHSLRAEAFLALRELLVRFSARAPLVIVIDDLQWADNDSLALLSELFHPRTPLPLLFLGGLRPSARERVAAALDGEVRVCDLTPLPPDDAARLAELLLPAGSKAASRIAAESAGHPLFIAELVQSVARGPDHPARLEDVILARVSTLDVEARRLLELLALSRGPLPLATLHAAASGERAVLTTHLVHLRAQHLVRTSGPKATDRVEIFHDRIRAALTEGVTDAPRLHTALAHALEADANAPPEAVADHWRAAGDRGRAAAFVLRAADDAAAALAFDRAARLYEMALEHDPAPAFRVRYAEALQNGGRGGQAANVWLTLAASATGDEKTLFECHAAEQLLQSGNIARGLVVIERLLADMGLPFARTTTRRLVDLAVQRAAVRFTGMRYTLRDASTLDPTAAARVDALWAVGGALTMYDPFVAAPYRARHMREALRLGDAQRIARALAIEAIYSSVGGTKTQARTSVVLKECNAVAARSGTDYSLGFAAFGAGVCAYCEGRFAAANEAIATASTRLGKCPGVAWERASVEMFALSTFEMAGEWARVPPRLELALRDAKDRGDVYAVHQLDMMRFIPLILADRAAEVLLPGTLPENDGFDVPTYNRLVSRTAAQLYLGDGAAALSELAASWKELERTFLLHLQFSRIDLWRVRANAALLVAAKSPWPAQRKHLRVAQRDANAIAAEGTTWGSGLAALIRAGIAKLSGDDASARAHLDRAVRDCDAASMHLYSLAARRARGLLVGGDAGAAEVQASDLAIATQGARAPASIARLHLAGVFE